jgi:hypothetical protein
LDARVYLNDSGRHDVANLIVIGTPNGGDRLVIQQAAMHPPYTDLLNLCRRPALDDLRIGADDTHSVEKHHTRYSTIFGDWNPLLTCPLLADENVNYGKLINMGAGSNDHCHTGLLTQNEYDKSREILSSAV